MLINLLIALALKNMTSQKTWPHPPPRRDSHQHWPFLVVENNEDSHRRLSLPQTKGNVWNRFRFLKKHFMFLEELNRRIRENGINLRLSCIYLFQNIFPAAWSLPQNTASFAFFPDFSHLFSDSDHFFRDPWVPLTFFPAATLVVYHIPIKIREKNNGLTHHSVNAHTKPFRSEKQSLSESFWGSYQISSDVDYF